MNREDIELLALRAGFPYPDVHDEFEYTDDDHNPFLLFARMLQGRRLTDEVIGELWHQAQPHHHKFARALESWLKEPA